MANNKLLILPLVVSALALLSAPAFADTTYIEKTTTTTSDNSTMTVPTLIPTGTVVTTTTTRPVLKTITLAPRGNYVVVDPISGLVRGVVDPVTRLLNGQPLAAGLIVVDKATGAAIGVTDVSGQFIDIATVPATNTLITSIETRQNALRTLIADALAQGTITATQAASMRADLDRIAIRDLNARLANGNLTYAEALSLEYPLNILQETIVPVVRTSTVNVTPMGPRFIVSNGQLIMTDDVAFRRVSLERQIDTEYALGRLTNDQVARLKSRLNEIASLQTRYFQNGMLTASRTKTLNSNLDRVQTELARNIATTNNSRARLGLRVD